MSRNSSLTSEILAEMLTEHDKGCGNLVTFSHMIVVASFAALENVNWSTWQFRVSFCHPLPDCGGVFYFYFCSTCCSPGEENRAALLREAGLNVLCSAGADPERTMLCPRRPPPFAISCSFWNPATQTVNNKVFAFNISFPLHLVRSTSATVSLALSISPVTVVCQVFRSGSLMASMLVGVLYLKRTYKPIMIASVVIVTLGIFLATFASKPGASKPASSLGIGSTEEESFNDFVVWCIGIAMLVFALVTSAFMGAMQELTYAQLDLKKSDVPWQENLFYTHLLSIPVFLLVTPDIASHAAIFNSCQPLVSLAPYLGELPAPWFYLALNVLTQYVCIRGVYLMVSVTDALTCTLLLSIRKLLSLVVSIWVFRHPFTVLHGAGVYLVIVGSFFYIQEQMTGGARAAEEEEESSTAWLGSLSMGCMNAACLWYAVRVGDEASALAVLGAACGTNLLVNLRGAAQKNKAD